MKRFLTLLAAWLLFVGPAFAGGPSNMPLLGVSGASAASYTGPCDLATFTIWWGLRACSGAIAAAGGNIVNIRNATTGETCDVPSTTTGGLGLTKSCSGSSNGDSVATFCALSGGPCTVHIFYDQVGTFCAGAACNVDQSNTSKQDTLVLTCLGASNLPCITSVSGGGYASAGQLVNVVFSVSLVAYTTAVATGDPTFIQDAGPSGNNKFTGGSSANTWTLRGGDSGTGISGAATSSAWHAANGGMSGGTANLNIDGTETSGGQDGGGDLTQFQFANTGSSGTQKYAEGGISDNHAFTGTERTNLCHNQYSYWATSTSC